MHLLGNFRKKCRGKTLYAGPLLSPTPADQFLGFGSYSDLYIIIAPHAVDDRRDDPTGEKDADDNAAKHPKIQVANVIPDSTTQVELRCDDTHHFYRADDQCNKDGDECDIEIIVELADRFDKSPTICSEHQNTVGGIHQAHPSREERREDQDIWDRKSLASLDCCDAENPDFGRCIKSQSKEHPNRIHFPTLVHQPEQGAEETSHQPALVQKLVQGLVAILLASLHLLEGLVDFDEHEDIDDGDQIQKSC